MTLVQNTWNLVAANRMRLLALLLVILLLCPQPAPAQFGFFTGLLGIVTSGLSGITSALNTVNTTLNNVIRPILQGINNAIAAAQQTLNAIFDFQRNIVYPQAAIDNARALIGQIRGIYNTIRGIWNTAVRSATLAAPRALEDVILSKDVGRIGEVATNFSAVYTPLPPATDAHPYQRDLIDSQDAAAQAAMKRSIAIDAIADQELQAADQIMSALQGTAPGTAEMIGAQAGAWLVRSNAYTQQALAELMRLRSIELAGQGALTKESARYTRDTRNKLLDLNK